MNTTIPGYLRAVLVVAACVVVSALVAVYVFPWIENLIAPLRVWAAV